MKTRAITELFKQAPFPVALLDEGEPEWHNAAFECLDKTARQTLIEWSGKQADHSRRYLNGLSFELLIAGRHRLLIASSEPPVETPRSLLRQLLPALSAGGDPWLNTAATLGPLLGWQHCAAVKHKSSSADDLLGHWHQDALQPPRHLPLQSSLAAQLYAAEHDQLLIEQPATEVKADPLLDRDTPDLWIAQRVDDARGNAWGYLSLWGAPDAQALSLALYLLPLAAEVLNQHLTLTRHQNSQIALPEKLPTDELTGLPKRAAFDTILESFERHYAEQGQDCQLAILDIDGLSEINHTHGIKFGDKVLRHFAEQLTHQARPDDQIFRFGGDEFVILMPFNQTPPPLQHRLEKIERKMREQDGIESFSVSAGLACLSETNGSSDDLMLLCDRRLRQNKQLRGNSNLSEA